MGQNIYAHIEVKYNGKWEHHSAPRIVRDYALFGLMGSDRAPAGIRPVAGITRGLPKDASTLTAIELVHDVEQYGNRLKDTVRALDADGIEALQEAYAKARPDRSQLETDLEETVFRTYVNHGAIFAHKGFEDVRIVYWFEG